MTTQNTTLYTHTFTMIDYPQAYNTCDVDVHERVLSNNKQPLDASTQSCTAKSCLPICLSFLCIYYRCLLLPSLSFKCKAKFAIVRTELHTSPLNTTIKKLILRHWHDKILHKHRQRMLKLYTSNNNTENTLLHGIL